MLQGWRARFTACLVAAVLAFATRLIQHMPHNAQGAIVLSGVAGILQFGEAAFLWRVRLLRLCWAQSSEQHVAIAQHR